MEKKSVNAMPRAARQYWWTIIGLGLLCLAFASTIPLPSDPWSPWELGVFSAIALLFGGQKIKTTHLRQNDEAMSITLGFAITFACMLRLGPGLTVPVSMLCCLSSCLFPKRQKSHQLIFNISLSAVEALIGGIIFAAINGWTLELTPVRTVFAVAGGSAGFFLVNTFGVSNMVARYTGEKLYPVWKDNFLWTAPSYIASATFGVLAMFSFRGSFLAFLLFVLPVAYLIYQSFGNYIARAVDRRRIDELNLRQAELADMYLATVESLALAIDAKDQHTQQRILRVQTYSVAIAQELGISGYELQGVRTCALLHDIGKLGVPEYVLMKPGPLTPDEFEKVKKHPEIGAAILDPVYFPWPVLPAIKHHHEHWDGSGYPDGLKGEEIPVIARIIAVADGYEALTCTRAYRVARSHEEAKRFLRESAGQRFDPAMVEAFLRVVDNVIEKTGADLVAAQEANKLEKVFDRRTEVAAKNISRASAELWALYEVTQSLSSSLGLQETADIVVRKIQEIYEEATCAFMLWDNPSKTLSVRSAFGPNRELFTGAYTNFAEGKSILAVHSKQAYFGSYDESGFVLNSKHTPWIAPNIALIIPIYHDGAPIGTIDLYHPHVGALTEDDRQFLEMVAERSSSALFNGILYDRTRNESILDPLTGTHNLRFLFDHLDKLCDANGRREPFAMLCTDLDNFKLINDGYGHAAGDDVLQYVSRIFRQFVGPRGIVGRRGGDEFVMVVPCCDEVAANALVARICDEVAANDPNLRHPTYGRVPVGVSIGVSYFPHDGTDAATLLAVADKRMYTDKMNRKLNALADPSTPPLPSRETIPYIDVQPHEMAL